MQFSTFLCIFISEDEGDTFFRNVSNTYKTARHHVWIIDTVSASDLLNGQELALKSVMGQRPFRDKYNY